MAKKKRKRRPTKRVALIDGDVMLYRAVFASMGSTRTPDDEMLQTCDMKAVCREFDQSMKEVRNWTGATDILVCLGSKSNWRKKVMPEYKANRKQKPLGYAEAVSWCKANYETKTVPFLEADDVIGLYATNMHLIGAGSVIIVSVDKDFNCVPQPRWHPAYPDRKFIEVDRFDAIQFHMKQTMIGDTADHYPGCPGVGKKTADKLIDPCETLGQMWRQVVTAFARQELGRDEAIRQARVAHLLQGDDYDFDTGELTLWEPPTLTKKCKKKKKVKKKK